jgi:hypothetical protein
MMLIYFEPVIPGGPTNPVGIILTIIEFIAGLLGLGQNNIQVLQTAINNTYANLVTTTAFLYNGLGFLTQSLGGIFGSIKDWLDDLRWLVIVPIIEKIQQIIDDITTWLANILDPLITFIQNVLKWYNTYIRPWLMLVQQILSVMRAFLTALKLLGVKWAAKLDADIQLIQSWVTEIMQTVTATLNSISSILGIMVDPTGILKRDFFGASMFGSLAGIKRANGFGADRPSLPSEITQANQNNALIQSNAQFFTVNPDDSVTGRPGMAAIDSDVRAGYAGLGVTVPPA